MPSKRGSGTPKKALHSVLNSPRLIDKKVNRNRHAEHIASLRKEEKGHKHARPHQSNIGRLYKEAHEKGETPQRSVPSPSPQTPVHAAVTSAPVQDFKIVVPEQPREQKIDVPVPKDMVRVFALAKIRQLLNVAQPGSVVAFDIDETLVMTRNQPCVLLQPVGVEQFTTYIRGVYSDFSTRNLHCRKLQTALKDKVTVEDDTVEVFRALQARGCRMFAITARYSELAERTERVLDSFGISFLQMSPFRQQAFEDSVTEAVVRNGIVYCNGEDKGVIISRLFSHVLFPEELKAQVAAIQSGGPLRPPPVPGFYFLDDRVEHVAAVAKSLDSLSILRVPSVCFHYRAPVLMLMQAQAELHASRPEVLGMQMRQFHAHGVVLTNSEALMALENAERELIHVNITGGGAPHSQAAAATPSPRLKPGQAPAAVRDSKTVNLQL